MHGDLHVKFRLHLEENGHKMSCEVIMQTTAKRDAFGRVVAYVHGNFNFANASTHDDFLSLRKAEKKRRFCPYLRQFRS